MNRPTRTVPSPDIEEIVVEEAHSNNVPATADQTRTAAEIKPEKKVHHKFKITALGGITGAIASIMSEIRPVEKEGFNKFHGYKYARMQDLSRELTPLMGKYGIVIFQTEVGREMFDNGAAIAVRYRFTIAHKSGEIWPEHPIQTGLSSCRNTKSGFDDKALNKCHTSARKYFLLSLFQIPTSDDDDADSGVSEGDDTLGTHGHRVSRPRRQVPAPNGKIAPHVIAVNAGEHPQDWAARFLAFVVKAESDAEIDDWYNTNHATMDKINKHEDGRTVMDSIIEGMDARAAALSNVQFDPAVKPAANPKPAQQAPQRAAPPPPARQQAKPADPLDIPPALRRVNPPNKTPRVVAPSVEDVEQFFQFIAGQIERAPDMEAVQVIWDTYVFDNTDGNGKRDEPKILPPDLEALHDLVDQKKEQLQV